MNRLEILQYSINTEIDCSIAPEDVIRSLWLISVKNIPLNETDFISKTITDFPMYFKKIKFENKLKVSELNRMTTDDILHYLKTAS